MVTNKKNETQTTPPLDLRAKENEKKKKKQHTKVENVKENVRGEGWLQSPLNEIVA